MILVFDSNIFAHCVPLPELDLKKVLGGTPPKDLAVLVTEPILNELDKIKDTHKNGKVRDRVRAISTLIDKATSEDGFKTKNGVGIIYPDNLPAIHWEKHNLSRESADHHILGTILAYKELNPHIEVVFFSNDTAPRIKAKRLGLDARPFPQEYLLVGERDEKDDEIAKLRTELGKHLKSLPKLKLRVKNDKTVFKYVQPKLLTKDDIVKRLSAIKAANPPEKVDSTPPSKLNLYALSKSARRRGEDYNLSLEKFYGNFEKYLKNYNSFAQVKASEVKIELILENTGHAPANDIDLTIDIQDIAFLEPCPLPKEPEPPHHPSQFFAERRSRHP